LKNEQEISNNGPFYNHAENELKTKGRTFR